MSDHGHPEGIDLLRFADGELGPRETRRVRRHLDSCWQCRTELEDIERTIGECVRYRNHVLQPGLPSPPAPWIDIQAAFSRLDAAGRGSFAERIFGRLRGGARWLVPMAAAAAVCLVYFEWRDTPAVQAAELLRKASAAAESQPVKPRRIQIRTRTRKVTRVVGVQTASAGPEDELAGLFRAARYSWEDPLSARSFQAWRDTLPEKKDEIVRDAAGVTIRTATEAGELRAASLALSEGDLRPVQARLEFRNDEIVDIAEAPEPPPQIAQTTVNPPPPAAIAPPAPEPARVPGPADELRVVAALHGIGADLGDPLEIARTPSGIVVSGIGIAPERQRAIRNALRPETGVTLRFEEPGAVPPQGGEMQSAGGEPPRDALRFQSLVERQLGGRAQFEQFSAGLLDASEAMISRAYAIRRLAQRFPAGSAASLDPASRATLAGINRDHAAELARAAANIRALAGPVMTSLGGTASAVQQRSIDPRAWQAAAEDLFQSAGRVERLLAAMLDGSPSATAPQDLPSRLLTSLAALQAEAGSYRRNIAQEPSGSGK